MRFSLLSQIGEHFFLLPLGSARLDSTAVLTPLSLHLLPLLPLPPLALTDPKLVLFAFLLASYRESKCARASAPREGLKLLTGLA